MKKVLLIATAIITLASCTENVRARRWGGTEEVMLKPNEVLLNVTWKESDMWVLTRDTITNVKHFREHSSWGIIEGEIILK